MVQLFGRTRPIRVPGPTTEGSVELLVAISLGHQNRLSATRRTDLRDADALSPRLQPEP